MCARRGSTAIIAGFLIATGNACSNTDSPVSPPVIEHPATSLGENISANLPVIFLHYDYMRRPGYNTSLDTTTNSAPDPETIALVVKAFRDHGISLVIDPQHTEIPYSSWLSFTPTGHGCPLPPFGPVPALNFYELKAQYFHPKGNQPWHYAIFGDRGCTYDPQVGGASELPGYNFMVSVAVPHWTCFLGGIDRCKLRQAAMFMHELGHNLDLHHGGDEEENYKPNYVSVMNYAFSWGIPFTAPGNISEFRGQRLDYSNGALPALDELNLNEGAGLGGPAGDTDLSWYLGSRECGDYTIIENVSVARGPVDWNRNGVIENGVAVDVNFAWTSYFTDFLDWTSLCPKFNSESSGLPLHDFDDWTHLKIFINTPRYAAGMLRATRIVSDSVDREDHLRN